MPRYIREPYGYGQRSGKKIPLRKAVYDGIYRGLRDSPEWVDDDHPQRYPIPVVDKEALENPLPRDEAFSHTVHVNRLVDGETFEHLPLWGPLKANLSENVSVQGSYTEAGLTVTYTLQLAPPVRTGTIELSGSLSATSFFGVGATAGAQVSVQTLSAVAQLDDGVSILVFPSFILATLSADIGFDAAAVTVGGAAGAQTFQVTGSLAPVTVQAAASVQALEATSALGSATVAANVSVSGLSMTASINSVTITSSYEYEYLVVGGGGGGGEGSSGVNFGGGGAGGTVRPGSTIVNPGQALSITVGVGGASAADGSASSIAGVETAPGGLANPTGPTGGSNADFSGGSGTGTAGGGGAGAGGNGGNAPSAFTGGVGGAGVTSSISGTSQTYGGGGGGGAQNTGGSGGAGGGGAGTANGVGAQNGAPNTGGGGGGGNPDTTTGGGGVVIIRYLGTQRGSGGTVTSSGGYTIHTFSASGVFTG